MGNNSSKKSKTKSKTRSKKQNFTLPDQMAYEQDYNFIYIQSSGPSGPNGYPQIYAEQVKGYVVDDGVNQPYGMSKISSYTSEPYCNNYSCIPQPYSTLTNLGQKQQKYNL